MNPVLFTILYIYFWWGVFWGFANLYAGYGEGVKPIHRFLRGFLFGLALPFARIVGIFVWDCTWDNLVLWSHFNEVPYESLGCLDPSVYVFALKLALTGAAIGYLAYLLYPDY